MTCYDPLAKVECTPKIPKIPKYLLKGTPAHSNVGGSWKTDEAQQLKHRLGEWPQYHKQQQKAAKIMDS